ncbi:MAG: hypothetical protein IKX67_05130 [Bacteroidales bacterium]|nr:hypothetical protein [Bacteroidales bacterium]
MKKVLFIVAAATLFIAGCEKENTVDSRGPIVLKAFTEPTTKATLNDQFATVWSSDDKVGLVVSNGANDWYTNQECYIEEDDGAGTTNATFTSTTTYNDTDKWNIAAFFPWNGSGGQVNNFYTSDNNAYNGTMYFKLPASYYGYTSGKSVLPMLANMAGDDTHPTEMHFKHVGAAVKVTLCSVPKGAHSIGMTVANEQIWGDCDGISSSNAGNDSDGIIKFTNPDFTKNTVWLNFPALEEDANMVFLFPVPPISKPKLSFQMYNENNAKIWETKLKAQKNDLNRGEILVMPEISIEHSIKVTVGIISYLLDELHSGFQVHYWGEGIDNGDADLTDTGKIVFKSVGDYWDNQQQEFYIYTTTLPINATGYKVHNGDRWFGLDGSLNKPTAYIFNYSGDKALYE